MRSFSPLMPEAHGDRVIASVGSSIAEAVKHEQACADDANSRWAFVRGRHLTRTIDRVIAIGAAQIAIGGNGSDGAQLSVADHFGRRNGLSSWGTSRAAKRTV